MFDPSKRDESEASSAQFRFRICRLWLAPHGEKIRIGVGTNIAVPQITTGAHNRFLCPRIGVASICHLERINRASVANDVVRLRQLARFGSNQVRESASRIASAFQVSCGTGDWHLYVWTEATACIVRRRRLTRTGRRKGQYKKGAKKHRVGLSP